MKLLLVGLIFFAGCSVPVTNRHYFIAAPATQGSDSYESILRAVRQFAVESGYQPIAIASPRASQLRVLGIFARGPVEIRVFKKGNSCLITTSERGYSYTSTALAERQRLYSALQARGMHGVKLLQESCQKMDIIP